MVRQSAKREFPPSATDEPEGQEAVFVRGVYTQKQQLFAFKGEVLELMISLTDKYRRLQINEVQNLNGTLYTKPFLLLTPDS